MRHKLNTYGVKTAEQKVQAITNWPVPTSVKQVQVFLGAVGWYRKLIKKFSTVARPLTRLLEKEVKFTWGKSEEKSFKTLKHALITAPVLSYPVASFLVTTDASKVGLGGDLFQVNSQGQIHPVAYFSALTKRQRSYPTYDREVIAMRETLRHIRYYLLGAIIVLKTDHKPLLKLEGQGQVLVPAHFVPTNLSLAHEAAVHQGPKKMLARIEPHYWWPNLKAEIEYCAKSCKQCDAMLAQGHRKAPIHQRPREMKQFALIEADLKGPLPRTKECYDNIVVITDPTTKYWEMHPIRRQTSEMVCRIIKCWISRYDLPKKLHSDNGTCFISTNFQQFCTNHGTNIP